MANPVIAQKSPYVLDLDAGTYWWCACGKSTDQPFCDGSHEGTGISPVLLEMKEKGQVRFCGCKHSKNAPRCDGTHKSL
jgi:CDGSH-type Zn-finger protein